MWCAKCQDQVASSRGKNVQRCPRCAGPLTEETPDPNAAQQAQELLQRWADDDPLVPVSAPTSTSSPATARQPGDTSGPSSDPMAEWNTGPGDGPSGFDHAHDTKQASKSVRRNFRVDAAHRDDQPNTVTGLQEKSTETVPSQPAAASPPDPSQPTGAMENVDDAVSTVASTLASLPPGHHGAHKSPTGGPHVESVDRGTLASDSAPAATDVTTDRQNHPSTLWAQSLAYAGVLGLTGGGILIVWNGFGHPPIDGPTSWLVATGGQILLFLGVVTLISKGMEQTTEDISQQVRGLHERLLRIEQAESNDVVSPPHTNTAAVASDTRRCPTTPGHADTISDDHETGTPTTKP